jgi:hypothetical protein
MKKLFAFIAPLLFSTILYAYTDKPLPPANEESKVSWHSVSMIDFKPGTLEEVKVLIRKFETAAKTAGTILPEYYWFESGKYDLVLTWKLKDGKADFQGKWSPCGDPWWKALVEMEGSEEAALELQAQYDSLVESSHTTLARRAQ